MSDTEQSTEQTTQPAVQEKPFKDSLPSVTSGYVGWLTPEEETALATVKSQVVERGESYTDDYEVLRFLRARKFDVEAATTMLVKYKQWYRENNVARYPHEYPKKAASLGEIVPSAYFGFDRDGHPIKIERTGKIDCPTLLSHVSDNEILLGYIWGMELQNQRCLESARERGLPEGSIERGTTIMDLEGLNMGHRAMTKFLSVITKTGEAYYPERLAYTLIVNAPFVFNFFWGLVKWTLDPVTREKVLNLGSHEELQKYVDPSQLPTRYGGTAEVAGLDDPDVEALRTKYLNDERFQETYETITVTKGHYVREFDCVPGQIYNYCFRSNEDIKFKAMFVPVDVDPTDEDKVIVVSNEAKVEASRWPILGSFYITDNHPGKLILTWENDNWWGDKELKFALLVTPDTGDEVETIKISLDSAPSTTTTTTTIEGEVNSESEQPADQTEEATEKTADEAVEVAETTTDDATEASPAPE